MDKLRWPATVLILAGMVWACVERNPEIFRGNPSTETQEADVFALEDELPPFPSDDIVVHEPADTGLPESTVAEDVHPTFQSVSNMPDPRPGDTQFLEAVDTIRSFDREVLPHEKPSFWDRGATPRVPEIVDPTMGLGPKPTVLDNDWWLAQAPTDQAPVQVNPIPDIPVPVVDEAAAFPPDEAFLDPVVRQPDAGDPVLIKVKVNSDGDSEYELGMDQLKKFSWVKFGDIGKMADPSLFKVEGAAISIGEGGKIGLRFGVDFDAEAFRKKVRPDPVIPDAELGEESPIPTAEGSDPAPVPTEVQPTSGELQTLELERIESE